MSTLNPPNSDEIKKMSAATVGLSDLLTRMDIRGETRIATVLAFVTNEIASTCKDHADFLIHLDLYMKAFKDYAIAFKPTFEAAQKRQAAVTSEKK